MMMKRFSVLSLGFLFISFPALSNPNRVQIQSLFRGTILATPEFYLDAWENYYEFSVLSYGTIRGKMTTPGCSEAQDLLGKKIGEKLHVVVASTASGDCYGGYLEMIPSQTGYTGTWSSPITGENSPLVLTSQP